MPEPLPRPVERSDRLHPQVRRLLEEMDALGAPPLETQTPEQARPGRTARMKMLGGMPEPLARIEDIAIPAGETGSGDAGQGLALRLYATEGTGLRPALIYFHGGGFVFGNLDTHEALCHALAIDSGIIVVAVDYRLAPEHRYPAAVEDADAATRWIVSHAESLGIDPSRISTGGDSAGGTLATVVAMRCREAGTPRLRSQVLFYPVTDVSSLDTASYRDFAEGYSLTRAAMDWFRGHYLGSAERGFDPEASPLLAPDLTGLPPALVVTAEFDPLRDEGEAYAERLRQAGVAVTLTRYPGMIHGFVANLGAIPAGRQAIRQAGEYLRSVNA